MFSPARTCDVFTFYFSMGSATAIAVAATSATDAALVMPLYLSV